MYISAFFLSFRVRRDVHRSVGCPGIAGCGFRLLKCLRWVCNSELAVCSVSLSPSRFIGFRNSLTPIWCGLPWMCIDWNSSPVCPHNASGAGRWCPEYRRLRGERALSPQGHHYRRHGNLLQNNLQLPQFSCAWQLLTGTGLLITFLLRIMK